MDLKQLKYFATIAEMGQITSAAKKLYIAQPALSHSLKTLEEELGVKLFERLPSGIRITNAGSILLEKSYEILKTFESIPNELKSYKDGVCGSINIGLVSSSADFFLNQSFQAFREHYPKVTYNLWEGNTFQVVDYLKRGVVEMGFIRTPFVEPNLDYIQIQSSPMVAVSHQSSFPFDGKDHITLNELEGFPLIINRRYYPTIDSICHQENISLEFYCFNNDARTTIHWASAGLGIGIVPKEVVTMSTYNEIKYIEIAHPELYTSICVVWDSARPQSIISSNFLSYFKDN